MEIRDADDLRDDEYPDEEEGGDGDDTRPCPACGADVHDLSDHCPHCGHWIVGDSAPAHTRTVVWIIIAVVVAIALLLYVVL